MWFSIIMTTTTTTTKTFFLFLLLLIFLFLDSIVAITCDIDIVAPIQGSRIANANVVVDVRLNCKENRSLNICISFDENEPSCAIHEISENIEYRLEASLSNVHVGDHVLRSWIRDSNEGSEIRFRSLLVERPWWKSFEKPSNNNERKKNKDTSYISDVDAELLPNLLGPRIRTKSMEIETRPKRTYEMKPDAKTLVAIFVGKKSIGTVSSNIKHLGFEKFSYIVFNYDGCNLIDQEWFDRVIVVTAIKQMKWWFIKRFVTPSMMASYDYVFVVDADCDMSSLDGTAFVRDLARNGVQIGQPAHSQDSFQPQYPFLIANNKNLNKIGMWSNFIESGPLVAFSRDVWSCVWDLLQPDLTSGYGYDLVWVPACANGQGAVLYRHVIHHMNEKSASHRPNFVGRSVGEAHEFFKRISLAGIGPETPNVEGIYF